MKDVLWITIKIQILAGLPLGDFKNFLIPPRTPLQKRCHYSCFLKIVFYKAFWGYRFSILTQVAKIGLMVHQTKNNNFQVLAGSAGFLMQAYCVGRYYTKMMGVLGLGCSNHGL